MTLAARAPPPVQPPTTMTTTETTTTQIGQLRHVTAAVTALVEHATPDQLLEDSPCVGWR